MIFFTLITSLTLLANNYFKAISKVEAYIEKEYVSSGFASNEARKKLSVILAKNLPDVDKVNELKKDFPGAFVKPSLVFIPEVEYNIVSYSVDLKIDQESIDLTKLSVRTSSESDSLKSKSIVNTRSLNKGVDTNISGGFKLRSWFPSLNGEINANVRNSRSNANTTSDNSLVSAKEQLITVSEYIKNITTKTCDLAFGCMVDIINNTKDTLEYSSTDNKILICFGEIEKFAEIITPKGNVFKLNPGHNYFQCKITLDRTGLLGIIPFLKNGGIPVVAIGYQASTTIKDSSGHNILNKIKEERKNLISFVFIDRDESTKSFSFRWEDEVTLKKCLLSLNEYLKKEGVLNVDTFTTFTANDNIVIGGNAINYAKDSRKIICVRVDNKVLDNEKEVKGSYGLSKRSKVIFEQYPMDNAKNKKDGIEEIKKYVKHGNSYAQFCFGGWYFEGKVVEKDPKKGAELLKKSAEQGFAEAQYRLGLCYDTGEGVVYKNSFEAVKWYKKSAEQGNAKAQCILGVLYFEGTVLKKDPKKGVELLKKSAEQGNAEAQFYLGVCYDTGEGVAYKDSFEAVKWYKKSAEQGNAEAQCILGRCYLSGYGVAQDNKKGVELLKKSAEQGLAEAQYILGECYEYGNGVDKNDKEAVKWYEKSAGQGLAEAQFNLGVRYEYGAGVDKNEKEAVKWYKKSAGQGNARAQFNLGDMYRKGKGIKQNYKLALEWYEKAKKSGYHNERYIEDHINDCKKNLRRINE